ncbi:MAG: hypothetical protein HC887_00975 [Desulfobacteraceae bacterium]|nr:hypothetical protein [Desulfobacteraceae bacterium]
MMELAQLESLVAQYETAQPDLMRKIEPQLRHERKILIETFMNASDTDAEQLYKAQAGKAFHLISGAGLHNMPRTADEEQLLGQVFQKWQMLKSPSAGILLAIMLMCPPYQLPVPALFSQLLPWLRTAYARYLLTRPAVFHQPGEADRYADFLTVVSNLFRNSLLSAEAFPEASEIADMFIKESDFTQIYFNEKNLSRVFRLRAEIAESLALAQKLPLSYMFPMSRPEQKLKIGIIASALDAQPETLLLLSYLERLPKEYCTVTIYTLKQTGHHSEEHCKSRADRLICLSDSNDDIRKVQQIREDVLDVMLIGSNVTATFDSCTRLAMFRLAKIQVVVENSPLTSGLTHSDYYLSSEYADPDPAAQAHYTEKLYRVPGTMGYYAYHADLTGKHRA